MLLIVFWIFFVLLLSLFHVNTLNYCVMSFLMYLIVFIYNKKMSVDISLKSLFGLLFLPNLLVWHVILIYNDFLCIYPLNRVTLISILLICYTFLFLFGKCLKKLLNNFLLKNKKLVFICKKLIL